MLEWSRGSAEGEARGTSEAERKHWPLPRDVTGLTSRWPGIQLCLGYSKVSTLCRHTVFPRIDAAAFIYFVVQFGAATIRGRLLFEGGVYYFGQYDRAPYTASLASSPSTSWYGSYKKHNTTTHNGQDCRPQIEH